MARTDEHQRLPDNPVYTIVRVGMNENALNEWVPGTAGAKTDSSWSALRLVEGPKSSSSSCKALCNPCSLWILGQEEGMDKSAPGKSEASILGCGDSRLLAVQMDHFGPPREAFFQFSKWSRRGRGSEREGEGGNGPIWRRYIAEPCRWTNNSTASHSKTIMKNGHPLWTDEVLICRLCHLLSPPKC